ncbi:MAG: ASPIC/UnbV domain-containing protein, partial [Gammaproteobacteria bacterium]
RNDGSAGIAIGNFAEEPTSLFRMYQPLQFSEDSAISGIAEPTLPLLTFGLVFVDLDLDGLQDIVTANGHIEPGIRSVMPAQSYAQPLQWLRNSGGGRFAEAGSAIGALQRPMVGRGLAAGDLDGDGDPDLVATGNNGAPRVLRNDVRAAHYLRVHLQGLPPNTDAIGARIRLYSEHAVQQRIVRTGGSYLSQSELVQTFGVAPGESVEQLEIRWPDGTISSFSTPATDRTCRIAHPKLPKAARRDMRGCRREVKSL